MCFVVAQSGYLKEGVVRPNASKQDRLSYPLTHLRLASAPMSQTQTTLPNTTTEVPHSEIDLTLTEREREAIEYAVANDWAVSELFERLL
jgi:hypothetical protein